MKTTMYNGESHLFVAVGFNKDTKDWYKKIKELLKFADGLIYSVPDLYRKDTNKVDNVSWYGENTHYALGAFKFIYPEKDKQKIFDLHTALGFRLGPVYRGENEELDKIFEELKKVK